MNYEQMSNNKLQLTGRVIEKPVFSHEVMGEGFYDTTLSVPRLSQQNDNIPITISERLLAQYNINMGDNISVEGQFRSYNKVENGKSRLLLTAFVRDIIDESEVTNPNIIEISGYICKPPVYRTTPFKREICDVLIAVNRAYNKSDYIPCIMWGRNARYVQTLGVGEKLNITGRIQSRVYVKSIGENLCEERVAYEVSVGQVVADNKINITDGVSESASTVYESCPN